MFWIVAVLVLLLAAGFTLWPLLRGGSGTRVAAALAVLAMPLAGYVLYDGVGTPQALDPPQALPTTADGMPDMEALTRQLRERLTESPDDAEGWVLLGRSYKTLQRYDDAVTALQIAEQLLPQEPAIQVELVEAELFASGNPRISAAMMERLRAAVEQDASLQKGLWLLGIAAAQAGDDAQAVEHWQHLLQQLEPGNPIEQLVTAQVSEARARLAGATGAAMPLPGETMPDSASGAATQATQGSDWAGVDFHIQLDGPEGGSPPPVPPGAVLYLIARAADQQSGPPLGVKRIDQPDFPLQLHFSNADSMMPQRPVSSAGRITVQARLSLLGQPTAMAGDWQSAGVTLDTGTTPPDDDQNVPPAIPLVINQEIE